MKAPFKPLRRPCLGCEVPTRTALCRACSRALQTGPFALDPLQSALVIDNWLTARCFRAFDQTGHHTTAGPWIAPLDAAMPQVPCLLQPAPKDPLMRDVSQQLLKRHPHLAITTNTYRSLKTIHLTRHPVREPRMPTVSLVTR